MPLTISETDTPLARLCRPGPGETCRVQVFRPIDDAPEKALAAAREMVEAHQLEWLGLESLQRERRLRRWWIVVEVRNPAQLEAATEQML